MDRAHSVPPRGFSNGNPFWSQKVQDECMLEASRPPTLPVNRDDSWFEEPIQNMTGVNVQSHQSPTEPTGKGRGGGTVDGSFNLEQGRGEMRTEGRMPE